MMLLRYLGKKRQHLAQKVKLRDFQHFIKLGIVEFGDGAQLFNAWHDDQTFFFRKAVDLKIENFAKVETLQAGVVLFKMSLGSIS